MTRHHIISTPRSATYRSRCHAVRPDATSLILWLKNGVTAWPWRGKIGVSYGLQGLEQQVRIVGDMRLIIWNKVALFAGGHLVLLVVLHALLSVYDPEPNGFRFDSLTKVLSFAVSFLPPAVVGLLAVRKRTVLFLVAVHAASPLLLIGNMRDPNADLNFAVLIWWFPLPLLFGVIAAFDRTRRSRGA